VAAILAELVAQTLAALERDPAAPCPLPAAAE
jgi:hypothetical protein